MIIKSEPSDIVHIPWQEDTSLVSRPNKRRRGQVEVLLPTKRQLFGNDTPAFENASAYIERNRLDSKPKKEEEPSAITLKFPHVEIKKEEMLSEDVVHRRIALVASYDVDLDPAIRDVTTTRTFTSKKWGGNTQSTFPSIRPQMVARHGMADFMYLNLLFNPHAPQRPGEPGLFFASSVNQEAHEWPEIERVLIRLRSNCWFYVGQYQCTPAASLTPEEWKSQAPKVKQTWATKVSTHGWGMDIRAKIVLQKRLGRDPTAQEFKDAIRSDEKFRATPEEIHRAFDQGHAFIQSWSMKCVGYDESFQRQIAAGDAAE